MAGTSIPLHIQKEIYKLRQAGHSIPEITEKLGVGWKAIKKYGGEVPKDRPKTKAEKAAVKSRTVHSDKTIAEHFKKDIKDVTKEDRNSYRRYLNRKSNPATVSFASALDKLRKEIIRVFPDNHKEILKDSRGKTATLESILRNPIFRTNFGGLADVAETSGLKPKVRNKAGANALLALRKGITELNPKPLYAGEGRGFTASQIIDYKAKEFAVRGEGKSSAYRAPHYQTMGRAWLMNLTPAQRVDVEAPFQFRDILNRFLRTKGGQIYPQHRFAIHHNMPFENQGIQTTNPSDVTVLRKAEHDKIHADRQLRETLKGLESQGVRSMESTGERGKGIWRNPWKGFFGGGYGSRSGVGAGSGSAGYWVKNPKTGRREFVIM